MLIKKFKFIEVSYYENNDIVVKERKIEEKDKDDFVAAQNATTSAFHHSRETKT